MTGLQAFVEDDTQAGHLADAPQQSLPIILFSFAGDGFILAAEQAVATIPMVPVTRLPGAHPGFAGAIQDRGRVIGLLAHPLALAGKFPPGARVILCGPPTLVPRGFEKLGCRVVHDLDAIMPEIDVVNVLRIQHERQQRGLFPSLNEYFRLYGMTQHRLGQARPDLLLLAPGPINRGVELTPEVADGPNSAILDQVNNGLAVRMAVLFLVCGQRGSLPAAS